MARKHSRTATIAPQNKAPLVPYAVVNRLNYWQFEVTVTDPARDFGLPIYQRTHVGRERANNVAKRVLNRYLRKLSYKQEPMPTYRAKGGAY